MLNYQVETFYFFKENEEDNLMSIRAWLMGKAQVQGITGLMILGTEGLNTTLASQDPEALRIFIGEVLSFFGQEKVDTKKSFSDKAPFKKFVVKIREEIVTLGRPEFVPEGEHRHLSPEEWHQMLANDDVVVVDTRNDYEYELGTFEKAIDLEIKEFTEFPEKIKEKSPDKEKTHLIFCTGGIRCEKAIFEMEKQGYQKVYQLDGGILNYMEKFPEGKFQGECFVFDSRVALGKDLTPTKKYSLCPQCGDVAGIEIECRKCQEPSKLCKKCLEVAQTKPEFETCSKNCRYHYKRDPKTKGPQQKQFYHS
jgi:UPF0176 protein